MIPPPAPAPHRGARMLAMPTNDLPLIQTAAFVTAAACGHPTSRRAAQGVG